MAESEMDARRIMSIVVNCIPETDYEGETIIVSGVNQTIQFSVEYLEHHKDEIRKFVDLLPLEFSEGGGWSFMNMVVDRNENQWGEQIDADNLLVLALATDMAQFLIPEEMWGILPGGMPYVVLK